MSRRPNFLSYAPVKTCVQFRQGGAQLIQLTLVRLLRQPRQQIFVVVAETPYLLADNLQVLLVELLLSNNILLSIQFSGVIKPPGQINDQSRLQRRHGQHKHIVGDQIFRPDPHLQNQKGLHSHLHGEKEQSRPALAKALLQQKTEPVTET